MIWDEDNGYDFTYDGDDDDVLFYWVDRVSYLAISRIY